jgi:hypothetical protein
MQERSYQIDVLIAKRRHQHAVLGEVVEYKV